MGRFAAVAAAVLVLSGCGASSDNGSTVSKESVSVHLTSMASDAEPLALERRLKATIAQKAVGEYYVTSWHATDDGGEAELLAYGPNADALWNAMKPIIEQSHPKRGSYALKKYSDPSKPADRVNLAP